MVNAINKISSTKSRGSGINKSINVAVNNTKEIINQFVFFILYYLLFENKDPRAIAPIIMPKIKIIPEIIAIIRALFKKNGLSNIPTDFMKKDNTIINNQEMLKVIPISLRFLIFNLLSIHKAI